MAKLLCENLTITDRVHLSNLKSHPGLAVIKKLLTDACTKATAELVSLDPRDSQYNKNLIYLQQRSRIFNEISADILASIEWHITEGLKKEEPTKETEIANRLIELARMGKASSASNE